MMKHDLTQSVENIIWSVAFVAGEVIPTGSNGDCIFTAPNDDDDDDDTTTAGFWWTLPAFLIVVVNCLIKTNVNPPPSIIRTPISDLGRKDLEPRPRASSRRCCFDLLSLKYTELDALSSSAGELFREVARRSMLLVTSRSNVNGLNERRCEM